MSKTKKLSKVLALVLMLALVLTVVPMGALAYGTYVNPLSLTTMTLTFGDTSNPTWPESYMYFSQESGNTYQAFYSTNGTSEDTSYYPDILSMYIVPNGNYSISSITGTDVYFVTFDSNTGEPTYSTTTTVNSLGFYAICPRSANSKIVVTPNTGSSNAVTVKFKAPKVQATTAGSTPKAVKSYLPIGQYATGAGWGSATGKFVNSFNSTGVSLGALGGYIEFDFDNPSTTAVEGITNDPRNPYGVDFVIYGNAFGGNPEAGAVQVGWEHNGTVTWYELAGSMYYDAAAASATPASVWHNGYTGTLRNADVTYTLNSSNISASMTDGTTTITASSFTTNKKWWPTTTEYPEFAASTYPTSGNAHTDGNVTVAYGGDTTGSTIVLGGITAIPDSNTTADYAFGYVDVTPNGTITNYGDAVNPYTPYTVNNVNKTGGDGFDLEWAVSISTGEPVDVSNKTFRYVRVYSAVLDNWTFGETSTEICGIYSAYRTTTEEALDEETGVGRTATPTIKIGNTAIATYASGNGVTPTQIGNVTYYNLTNKISNGKVITATGATYTYMNGTNTTSFTTSSTTPFLRIIAQTGDAAPSITLIKIH